MKNFADRLLEAVARKGTPCVVGLDPRVEGMPPFIAGAARESGSLEQIGEAIIAFHRNVIDAVAPLVPAVKLQIAFYEQYGLPGLRAFAETVGAAQAAGLLVIADVKRNDIGATAEAYASAFLGQDGTGLPESGFGVDCVTVSPFLGRDSLLPFVQRCRANGRGIFVLVKTSNPGSADVQNRAGGDGLTVSESLAAMVDELGSDLVGDYGYSPIGAVVGATFPAEAEELRRRMPKALILVPGYGAQGGSADGAVASFNPDGLGGVINASRSITYREASDTADERALRDAVRAATARMVGDIDAALKRRDRTPA